MDEVGETVDKFGSRARNRTWHMKPLVFVNGSAVEHGYSFARAAQTVQFGSRNRRSGKLMLDDLRESLARYIGAREQPITSRGPSRGAAAQDMDVIITERFEAARGLGRNAVCLVKQNHATGAPRHQRNDTLLEPAIWEICSEQRMTRSVLPLLAHIEKGDFAAIGQPSPNGLDLDKFGHVEPLWPDIGRRISILRRCGNSRALAELAGLR